MSKDTKIPAGATKYDPMYQVDTGDDFDIDAMLKKELEEQELDYRFVDFKKAMANGGRSRAGWIIYRRVSADPLLQGIRSISDPDGLVRQGSLVLAVKPRKAADRQRKRIASQNRTLKQYNEHVAQEVDTKAKSLGGSSRAIHGYDKN